ncbi:MAG: PEP-CTERM sorting domain-containing protein [Rubrivivax sp.]
MTLHTITDVDIIGQQVSGNAMSDYSMTWQGLTEVRAMDGSLVTNFTANSPDSGFNFASPVPEPGTLVLFAVGVLYVAARRASNLKKSGPGFSRLSRVWFAEARLGLLTEPA